MQPFIRGMKRRFLFTMVPQHDPFKFPLWSYLTQPVFSKKQRVRLSPWGFWRSHRLHYLERCWLKEYKPEEHYNS